MAVLDNPRHERFAQELAKGKTATEAYRVAGYKSHDGNASTLRGNQRVLARVGELQDEAAHLACVSKAWIMEKLKDNTERALQEHPVFDREGNPTGEYQYEGAVANRALELLGKELGMFVERTENLNVIHDISDRPATPEEWAAQHATAH